MSTIKTFSAALVASIIATVPFAASAQSLTDTNGPLSVSIGVTFDTKAMESLPLDTLAASIATGSQSAVSNATAVVDGDFSATNANSGATGGKTDYMTINSYDMYPSSNTISSTVQFNDQGFTSNVNTGNNFHY